MKSRYYDPAVGRFINADKFAATGQGILGANMFAYCNNNAVNCCDDSGSKMVTVNDEGAGCSVLKYDVPMYCQGDYPLCWAYNQLMLVSYTSGTLFSDEAAEAFALLYAKLDAMVQGKDSWDTGGFATICNEDERFEVETIEQLYLLLREKGPLYAIYENSYDPDHPEQRIGHSVIVTGVDMNNGLVFTNNPHGVYGTQSFSDFLNCYMGKNGPSVDRHLKSIYAIGWKNE